MADLPPTDGMGAKRAAAGRRRVSDEEWQQSLENMEESGAEEEESEYSDYPSDESLDVAAEFARDMEEQRLEDEKNGHFVGLRGQNSPRSGQFAFPAKDPTSNVDDAVAAPSRVSLATHKANELLTMHLDEILVDGRLEREGEILDSLTSLQTSEVRIQNEGKMLDLGRLHADNNGRIMVKRGGADSELMMEDIREFETEITDTANLSPSLVGASGLNDIVDSRDLEMTENLAIAKARNRSFLAEENNQLDLLENRSLVVQQVGEAAVTGPPSMGLNNPIIHQVSSLSGNVVSPSPMPHIKNPKPTENPPQPIKPNTHQSRSND